MFDYMWRKENDELTELIWKFLKNYDNTYGLTGGEKLVLPTRFTPKPTCVGFQELAFMYKDYKIDIVFEKVTMPYIKADPKAVKPYYLGGCI